MKFTQQMAARILETEIIPKFEELQSRIVYDSKYASVIDGNFARAFAVNGLFIASDVNWQTVRTKLEKPSKEYAMLKHKKNDTKIYDIVKDLEMEKKVNQEKFEWTIEEYCTSEVILKVSSKLKSECIDYIPYFLEKNKVTSDKEETDERAKPIMEWLKTKNKEEEIFYDLTEFEIITSIDVKRYLEKAREQLPVKSEDLKDITENEIEKIKEEVSEELKREAHRVSEIISEKIVYSHLQNAFKDQKPSRFLLYNPKKLDLSITKYSVSEKLGNKIELTSTITTDIKNKFKYEEHFEIEVCSEFFTGKIIPPKEEPYCEEGHPLKVKLKIKQKIPEIIKEYNTHYPINIKIISNPSKTVLDEKTVQVTLGEPNYDITIEGTRLPRKGEQITLDIKISNSKASDSIEVKVKCETEDFQISGLSDENKGLIIKVVPNKDKSEGTRTLYLAATRLGLWGYENTAIFSFYIGEWPNPFREEPIRMIVLPNVIDTAIAGVTSIAGAISVFYPNIIPSLTSEVNIANLSPLGALLYLAYRAFNWTVLTGKKTGR